MQAPPLLFNRAFVIRSFSWLTTSKTLIPLASTTVTPGMLRADKATASLASAVTIKAFLNR